ncbi:MAG: molybdate ABC transporter substrate-binding protein [Gammaproteobacteria bacterium]|nr:molybdate ABC transporter substrate-binding protein [Gammaproteobacteria bacterium]
MQITDPRAALARRRRGLAGLALALLLQMPAAGLAARQDSVTVFAAASLTNVLQELGAEYTRNTGHAIGFSFAAASVLARQIESGAHADIFFSADQEWMDYLGQRGLLQPSSRRNLLGNRLALVAPADSTVQLKVEPNFKLAVALAGGRLAMGDPDAVPVGRYARSALRRLGVWDELAHRLVLADNVRTALAFVARGEAPLGIVYATDAKIEPGVRIVDLFPSGSHSPIDYPIALTSGARPQAAAFIEFLRGPFGTAAFEKYGFIVLR